MEEQGPRNWHITVSDAGVGFDATQIQASPSGEHFGLSSMWERMELIGERCVIESEPGMGTRVRLEVPLLDLRLLKGVSDTAGTPVRLLTSSPTASRADVFLPIASNQDRIN